MAIRSQSGLVIGQWRESGSLRAVIDIFIETMESEIETPLADMGAMRRIDTAEGVWLDYLARRLGIERPYASDPMQDPRFGFEGAGQPFDTLPFRGGEDNDAVFPLPDVVFRTMVKARALLNINGDQWRILRQALALIDQNAVISDNLDMTVTVRTGSSWIYLLADQIGALPRPAGVRLLIRDTGRLGFDDAGLPMDQGVFGAN